MLKDIFTHHSKSNVAWRLFERPKKVIFNKNLKPCFTNELNKQHLKISLKELNRVKSDENVENIPEKVEGLFLSTAEKFCILGQNFQKKLHNMLGKKGSFIMSAES